MMIVMKIRHLLAEGIVTILNVFSILLVSLHLHRLQVMVAFSQPTTVVLGIL
jgi:hypothetical protein